MKPQNNLLQQKEEERERFHQLIGSKRTAVNWNALPKDHFLLLGWEQLKSQLWFAEDVAIARDKDDWPQLLPHERDCYVKGLAVLTMLDTYQGDLGVATIALSLDEEEHHAKAILNFMGMSENFIHAKSYSNIFQTLLSPIEEEELFAWVNTQKTPQSIINLILRQYICLKEDLQNPIKRWKAMVASVYLETWLFYSGFFYPLFHAAHSRLTGAGEIIHLIIRDEQVHGLIIGTLAQPLYQSFSHKLQEELYAWAIDFMKELYLYQEQLIRELYTQVHLVDEIILFTQYNADKALKNLRLPSYFHVQEERINPMVMNGLLSKSKDVDMFSMVGNGYMHSSNVTLDEKDLLKDEEEFDF
ncbi:ribonucleotide-diphosphate reductase subunit beta [Entomospira culicis]|uniref:ribonucleoside-diphosphate reductase n=1 Tax=Entomospira culicis TaxID=2719989 RepID=A0A968GFY9_9SPIO|nr:ribonucleotide-diphosphate reductase subunit beta [Entomospira culicis]NIZ19129.1 ribonucleotide-diphosphate reductase subunit beta [Entomospira culicis]NIZ69343.1 ribonucleotide-diphosphate reductase subunit beta [Entomospira culicis]WDI37929.1 ribonucleotide-diphosphate reductase subunit beta [Entomospira culicis]WDI39556.1 ribonucleotide-diphosphate reductase subunit beta [Entomospira culicis]